MKKSSASVINTGRYFAARKQVLEVFLSPQLEDYLVNLIMKLSTTKYDERLAN